MDPHFKAMLDAEAAAAAGQQAPPLDSLPVEMVRAGYVMQRTSQNTGAPKDVETRDLEVDGGAGPIGARLYTPAGAPATTPGLVYFHGGGFAIGNLETHDGHCRRLAAYSGGRVLAIDYRLAPENPFPASHDDAVAATRWAFDHAPEIGFDPDRIGVGGCSAGGNLAASVAIDMKAEPRRRLVFQMLLYPYICPETETESRKRMDGPLLTKAAIDWFVKCLAADGHPQIDRVILGSSVDISATPAAYVVTAGYDPLQDEGRDYARRLEASGVPVRHVHYPDLLHDFYIMGDVSPAVEVAAREAAEAMKAALS
jgi:acetyl esterase